MKKKILVYAGIVLAFLVLAYGFMPQILGGKVINQSDISGWRGMAHEMMEWNAEHPDDQTAWTESMFGGMPTTTIHASTRGDWTQPVYDLLLTGKRPAAYLFVSLLGAFLMLLALGISPWVAFGGAIAVTFCSYNIQIIQVGHNTKMQAIAFLPWVLAALFFAYRSACGKPEGRWTSWLPATALGAALFGLAVSLQVKANHPQITYYLALVILIYAIVLLVWVLAGKERRWMWKRFMVASALLLVLGVCGIGTNSIKLLPTFEYTPYSMRGGSEATEEGGEATKGLDIDYATAWSYGWEELPNLLIPNYNGGSSAGAVNPRKSATYDLLKRAKQPNLKEVSKNLPLYWGPQPFTAGPMYMGAVTIFLFVLGLCYYRSRREKWWIIAATVLAVLLALGSHFIWFTRLFYDYVPFYNKFRTVSMALVVLQFTLPVLGFLMLDSIVRDGKAVTRRQILSAGGITLGLCLLLAILQSIFGTFTGPVDAGQPDALVDALSTDRRQLLWSDTLRSLILIACAAMLLVWGLTVPSGAAETFRTQPETGLRRRTTAAVLVGLLVLMDLFIADKRYLNGDDFTTARDFSSQFEKRPVDEMILEDPDLSYRVLDLTVSVFNDSHPSYWHKNIGGYSPAKLQVYQKFINEHLIGDINKVYGALGSAATVAEAEAALPFCPSLSMLNCKYIIVGENNPPLRYPYAFGNAWIEDGSEDGPGEAVEMTSYAPHRMKYSYSSQTGGRMVFSEVFYPAGWKLRIDGGDEIPISCYEGKDGMVEGGLLRCADVPAGQHELVMSFEPDSYARGEALSRICSIVLLLIVLLAACTWKTCSNWKKKTDSESQRRDLK